MSTSLKTAATSTGNDQCTKNTRDSINDNDLRSKRKRRARKKVVGRKKKRSGVVTSRGVSSHEIYWEIDRIIDVRRRERKDGTMLREFKVSWKGTDEVTWEPEDNLCDSAFAEATRLVVERSERKLGVDNKKSEDNDDATMSSTATGEDDLNSSKEMENESHDGGPRGCEEQGTRNSDDEDSASHWEDASQIRYREIERIRIDDPSARIRVNDARKFGVPVCLVGHVGWAQFAKFWLKQRQPAPKRYEQGDSSLLDLSKEHILDVEAMENDIGSEAVPVIRRRYNEMNPIHGKMKLQTFLRTCWPKSSMPSACRPEATKTRERSLYLHQWQFPLSETAASKLCGSTANFPIPNDIIGEDLLSFWMNHEQCNNDSPYQYIFMGKAGTMSKLHRDNGGLLITIAPIVGEKEVVLVHRADGEGCLHHLEADLEKPDLYRFPMMSSARMWKSVIKPGEILLMPQGTYHQARNVGDCLSYSRFILDKENLPPFLDSFFNGDAPEIEHDDVLWNSCVELMDRLDNYVEKVRKEDCSELSDVPEDMRRYVETLKTLRNISREIARRLEVPDGNSDDEWGRMVRDIDHCLHCFRFRLWERVPSFHPKKVKTRKDNDKRKSDVEDEDSVGATVKDTQSDLEKALRNKPVIPTELKGVVISDRAIIRESDQVRIRLEGKLVVGNVVRINDPMEAAFLTFDDLPVQHDGFYPVECIRLPVAGESSVAVGSCRALRPGMAVLFSERGQEYRSVVKLWKEATFYYIRLDVPEIFEVWVTRDSIVEKVEAIVGRYVSITNESKPSSREAIENTFVEMVEWT